jgi:hypothetical protein
MRHWKKIELAELSGRRPASPVRQDKYMTRHIYSVGQRPGGADHADGHAALHVRREGKGREFDRDSERCVCDPGHRRRQWRDLGHGPH